MRNCSCCFILLLALLFTLPYAAAGSAAVTPSISDIASQLTQKNQATVPIIFTIGDPDTPLDSLTLTVSLSDTLVVSSADIVFGGSGADRTITLTPRTDSTGSVTVTVTVSDGVDSASDSFTLKVNAPPRLDINLPVSVTEGSSAPIADTLLVAVDPDGPQTQIFFIYGPDSLTGVHPLHSTVYLNGTPLGFGDEFTPDDLANQRVTIQHDGSEPPFDFFTLSVRDGDGGLANDAGFTVFHFNIQVLDVNDAPVALDTTIILSTGTTFNGLLGASDPDSPVLTYSIVTNGTLGTASLDDSLTGAYTYVSSGATGTDSLSYQVFDGFLYSALPGLVVFTIAEQQPVALADNGQTMENEALSDTLHGTDADLPPRTLTFSIGTNGTRGVAAVTDSLAGLFTYTPSPGSIGVDSFTFVVNDGYLTSDPATFTMAIRPNLDPGDIIFTAAKARTIYLLDPSTNDYFALATGGFFKGPRGVVVESDGMLIVLDTDSGIIRIDPRNGAQTRLAAPSNFTSGPLGPTSLALEQDGHILVADGTAGIKRINPVTGNVTVASSGNLIGLAVGVLVAPNGDLMVGDASAVTGGQSKVLRVNPLTGDQTTISTGGNMAIPVGLALDDSGNLYACDPASFAGAPADLVMKIDTATGNQVVLPVGSQLKIPTGIAVDPSGNLVIVNNQASSVIRIDPGTYAGEILVSDTVLFKEAFGLTIVRPASGFQASGFSLDFGQVDVGLSKDDSIVVENTGVTKLFITSVHCDSAQFTVVPPSASIPPGGSQTFTVTFTPSSDDTLTANLMFLHSGSNSPYNVTLIGQGIITGVTETEGIPRTFRVYPGYPNPFNPTANIRFDLPGRSMVTITVFNVLGQVVATPVRDKSYAPGTYTEIFDASGMASGVYFFQVSAGEAEGNNRNYRWTGRIVLTR